MTVVPGWHKLGLLEEVGGQGRGAQDEDAVWFADGDEQAEGKT